MQPDAVIHMGNSLVQHGPANDRVYLMKLATEDLPGIAEEVYELGRQHGYSKLFAKIPAGATEHFTRLGFVDEARVPGMCRGESAGYFMSKFLDHSRAVPRDMDHLAAVLDQAERKRHDATAATGSGEVIRLWLNHAEELAALYGTVFKTYPFPLDDPSFIRQAMIADTAFFGIVDDGKIKGVASMEMDMEWRCAEMTDFATLPEFRAQGAAGRLLAEMEKAMGEINIEVAYTIARAESFGMNIVFARGGYTYGGTLHNNTQIAGKLESMNVWHKQVLPRQRTGLPS